MLSNLPRPTIFAHRGASRRAPENTLSAFNLAVEEGADAIELDAKLTRDGRVVVFHDETLERTTDGHGPVSAKTLAELRELDAGSYFAGKFRGERIPLLDDVFAALGTRTYINIELRNYPTPGDDLVHAVCELVQRHALETRVMFSSFLATNLAKAARLLPRVPRGLLALRRWRGVWARSFVFSLGDYAALHPNIADVSRQQVQRVHRLRRRLHAWTVNQADDVRRLIEWGVDGIITDDPLLARETISPRSIRLAAVDSQQSG